MLSQTKSFSTDEQWDIWIELFINTAWNLTSLHSTKRRKHLLKQYIVHAPQLHLIVFHCIAFGSLTFILFVSFVSVFALNFCLAEIVSHCACCGSSAVSIWLMFLPYVYILYVYVDSGLTYVHPYTQIAFGAKSDSLNSALWKVLPKNNGARHSFVTSDVYW